MKILNHTYRGVESTESTLLKTPISELDETTELVPKSLIHIVQYEGDSNGSPTYQSKKMKISDFENKVYEAVQNTLKEAYFETHCVEDEETHVISHPTGAPTGTSFREMMDILNQFGGAWRIAEPDWLDPEWAIDGFVKHVNFDFEVLRRYVVLMDNGLQAQIDEIQERFDELDYFFTTRMTITTTTKRDDETIITHESVNKLKSDDDHYCQMSIASGNKISNTWTVPATGNLVIYGWLDSSAALNNKAIPSCFCVIEANINKPDEGDNWEIISAQPVIPAKNITYVGFNLPVRKGLVIRARTGFPVGVKSAQHPNEQDGNDTLSNDVPNGFKCQVFSNINVKESED